MSGTIDLYEEAIPQMQRTVRNVKKILTTAEAHFASTGKPEAEVFKLAIHPDMRPLAFQLLVINFNARHAGSQITGVPISPADFAYDDETFAGAQAFLDRLLAWLGELPHKTMTVEEADTEHVINIPAGKFLFSPKSFVRTFCLPNFYFHATTLYDLFRGQGVTLGKKDYLGVEVFKPAP